MDPDERADRRDHAQAERVERERGFLFSDSLLLAGHSNGFVHANFCNCAHSRLDGARAGTAFRQSTHSTAKHLHGAVWLESCADRATVIGLTVQVFIT